MKNVESKKEWAAWKSSIPSELLKPRLFQAKDKIQIKVFESGSLINLLAGFICGSTMRRTFEVKPLMDPILRTEHIAHHNKPGLFFSQHYKFSLHFDKD